MKQFYFHAKHLTPPQDAWPRTPTTLTQAANQTKSLFFSRLQILIIFYFNPHSSHFPIDVRQRSQYKTD